MVIRGKLIDVIVCVVSALQKASQAALEDPPLLLEPGSQAFPSA